MHVESQVAQNGKIKYPKIAQHQEKVAPNSGPLAFQAAVVFKLASCCALPRCFEFGSKNYKIMGSGSQAHNNRILEDEPSS